MVVESRGQDDQSEKILFFANSFERSFSQEDGCSRYPRNYDDRERMTSTAEGLDIGNRHHSKRTDELQHSDPLDYGRKHDYERSVERPHGIAKVLRTDSGERRMESAERYGTGPQCAHHQMTKQLDHVCLNRHVLCRVSCVMIREVVESTFFVKLLNPSRVSILGDGKNLVGPERSTCVGRKNKRSGWSRSVRHRAPSNLPRSVDWRYGVRVGGWRDWSEVSRALAGADVLRSALTSGGFGGVTCVKFCPDRHWLNTYGHLVSDCRRSVVDVVSKTNETPTMEFRQMCNPLSVILIEEGFRCPLLVDVGAGTQLERFLSQYVSY